MIRRSPWLVLFAVGLVAGCGQDNSSDGSVRSDRAQARETVEQYLTAFAAQDGKGICALLTPAMRARYGSSAAQCAREAARVARVSPIGPDCEIRPDASDDDARLVVHFTCTVGGGAEVTLVQERSGWLVDQDLSCVTPDFCKPG